MTPSPSLDPMMRRPAPTTAEQWTQPWFGQTPPQKLPPQPQETVKYRSTEYVSGEASPINTEEEIFRHSGWSRKRKAIGRVMAAAGCTEKALYAFRNCGSDCVVEFSKTENRHRLRASYCHCRHCEPCMRAKANKLARNLQEKLGQQTKRQYRFITLTMKHTDASLSDQIRHLYKSFRHLRNSKLWKKSQAGGAAALEVKWNARTRKWHPHLHVIAEGGFIQQNALSAAWSIASGGSHIVDIRALKDAREASYYVAKYVTKGINADVFDDAEAAAEWIISTRGLRVCMTYGTWRGFKLLKKGDDPKDWIVIDTLAALIAQAREGNRRCQLLLAAIKHPDYIEEAQARLFHPGGS